MTHEEIKLVIKYCIISTDKELIQFATTLEEAAATNIIDPTHLFMRQTQSYPIMSQH